MSVGEMLAVSVERSDRRLFGAGSGRLTGGGGGWGGSSGVLCVFCVLRTFICSKFGETVEWRHHEAFYDENDWSLMAG